MGRAERVTEAVRYHDYKLFCARNAEGKLCIYRKGHSLESYQLGENTSLTFVRPTSDLVCALTHNWQVTGYSVDWGIEPIMARLRDMDLWNRDLASEIIAKEEKAIESRERDRMNHTESFLYDFHSQFKKTFSDINTSNLSKKPKRKKEF